MKNYSELLAAATTNDEKDAVRKEMLKELLQKHPPVRVLRGELTRGTPKSAGFDLKATKEVVVHPGELGFVPTGLFTEMDEGWVGFICDKSGIAGMRMEVVGGVIDGDYPDEWIIMITNNGKEAFICKAGNRLAQVVFVEHGVPDKYVLKDGTRVGGFGSTGTE